MSGCRDNCGHPDCPECFPRLAEAGGVSEKPQRTFEALLQIRVSIRDSHALRQIDPESVERYLLATGWRRRTHEPDRLAWWSPPVTDNHGEDVLPWALVPLRTDFGDYDRRMADLLGCLEAVEGRSQLAIYSDLTALEETP